MSTVVLPDVRKDILPDVSKSVLEDVRTDNLAEVHKYIRKDVHTSTDVRTDVRWDVCLVVLIVLSHDKTAGPGLIVIGYREILIKTQEVSFGV